ncbi:amino acid transporter [Thermoplasma volcanium GSS1]|uniref:Amino acid transporter n=1 Tax=Thermoplasma volcanium (strain ATCC 51530 / DSM 4299 / JCM 9571 / NBRC 15438 / GSS1) TaxID=273116 RepID=Q97A75_THEVO|nr:APC family permease [Thermoplasma volcanium]BAB60077.1 amino acid transporter [Thermoplasma volcanium GSS1]
MARSLRRNVLNFREVLFQGVAASAPAGAAVATMTGSAAFALGSLPLAAAVAFVIVFLNALIIRRISTHVAGPGGYYDYIKTGFGKEVGIFSGWVYILYQIAALAFISLSIAVFVPALLSYIYGISVPGNLWIPLLIGAAAFGYLVSFSGIRGSLRYVSVMGSLEIAVVVFIGLFIILSHPAINTPAVFTLKYDKFGVSGIALGVLFMYTAFSGFGGMTPLGEEAKNAKKLIGDAVIISSVILGVFFVFAAYAFTVGWGPSSMESYANNLVPGIKLAQVDIGLWAAILITIFYINSILTDNVTFSNSVARITLSMSRDGVLPRFLSEVHEKRKTPHFAGLVMVIASVIIGLLSVEFLGPFGGFLFTGVLSTLAALLVHMLANLSLPVIIKKKANKVGVLNVALPVTVTAILVYVFYGTFVSISTPVVAASISFGAWATFAAIFSVVRRNKILESEYISVNEVGEEAE